MTPEHVLAIDFGSTWCKSGYLDRSGTIVAEGRAHTGALQVGEHDDLRPVWDALRASVLAAGANLRANGRSPRPAAIGLSCRGLFGFFLDADGQPLPGSGVAVASRSAPEMADIHARPEWGPAGPFAFSYTPRQVAAVIWYRQHRPDLWPRVRYFGAGRDWLVRRLTGAWVTDLATGPGQDEWPEGALVLSQLPLEAFPDIRDGHALAGGLTPEAAADLGLPAGTPVITGYHDGSAAGIGTGAINPGDTCLTIGTNLAYRPVAPMRLPNCFGYPIVRDRWAWVKSVFGSATRLDEVAALLAGVARATPAHHAALTAQAGAAPPGANGVRLPPGSRNQTPPVGSAVMAARAGGHGDGAIYLATLESLAFGLRRLAEDAYRDGARPDHFVATGGGAANPLFTRVISEVLGVPVELGVAEAGLLGAGIAAAVSAGWFPSVEAGVAAWVPRGPIVEPVASHVATYESILMDYGVIDPQEQRV